MNRIKGFGLAAILALGLAEGSAQIPKIPEFERCYTPDTGLLLHTDGPIYWKSSKFKVHNSPVKDIEELRGYVDLPLKTLGVLVDTVHIGMIDRLDRKDNIVESIIFDNAGYTHKLTPYDSALAKKEGIDISKITNIWHLRYSLDKKIIENLETGKRESISQGQLPIQLQYFILAKNADMDTVIYSYYKNNTKKMNITVDAAERMIKIGNFEIGKLENVEVYYDENWLPTRIVATVKAPYVHIKLHPEAIYDPELKIHNLFK